jgi:hypothetical protein
METTFPPFFSMILTAFLVRSGDTPFKESWVYFPNIMNIGIKSLSFFFSWR